MRVTGFCASEWRYVSTECASCGEVFAPEWLEQESCSDCLSDAAADYQDAANEAAWARWSETGSTRR